MARSCALPKCPNDHRDTFNVENPGLDFPLLSYCSHNVCRFAITVCTLNMVFSMNLLFPDLSQTLATISWWFLDRIISKFSQMTLKYRLRSKIDGNRPVTLRILGGNFGRGKESLMYWGKYHENHGRPNTMYLLYCNRKAPWCDRIFALHRPLTSVIIFRLFLIISFF